jgi:outer membrane receptor protein involved in Fe transport
MKKHFIIFLLLTILITVGTTIADEPLQALFFPYTISIDEAQKYDYGDFGDVLSLVPSIRTREIGLTGQFLPYRFRGIAENKTALLLDGQPIREPWSDQLDLNLIPVEMIERIEIYPAFNPFGESSIGGVTNIVTKDIDTKQPYSSFVYRFGTHKFSDLDISFGQVINPKVRILSGVLIKYFGDPLYSETYKGQKIRSRLVWQPFPNWKFRYDVLHNSSELDLAYSLPIPGDTTLLSDPHHKRIQFTHNMSTSGNLLGAKTHFQIDLNGADYEYRDQDFNPRKQYPVRSEIFSVGQDFKLFLFPISWKFSSEKNWIVTPEDRRFSSTHYHGFSQITIPILNHFISMHQLHGHVCSDQKMCILSDHQISWIPSTNTSFWAAYSETLRDPDLGEKFGVPFHPIFPVTYNDAYTISDSLPFLPNQELKPETGRTVEIGLQWKWKDFARFKCRGFFTRICDIIVPLRADHQYQFINQDKNIHQGFETQLEFYFLDHFSSRVALTYLTATDQNKVNLYERPNFWGNSSLNWEHDYFQNDLHVSLLCAARFWTDSWGLYTLSENISQIYLDPAFYLDFKISLTFLKQATLSFAVDNILNMESAVVAGYLLPARTNRFGISWHLLD